VSHFLKLCSEAALTLEQKLSAGLVFLTFLGLDPFYVVNLIWPSLVHEIALILLRDLLLCYIAFYILAVLVYFERDPEESQMLRLAFPYLCFLMSTIVLLVDDASSPFDFPTRFLPETVARFDPHWRAWYFAVLLVLFSINLALAFRRHLRPQENRFRFYAWTVLSILGSATAFIVAMEFLPWLAETLFGRIFPLALLTIFALVMDDGHRSAQVGAGSGYEHAGKWMMESIIAYPRLGG
jgi:hypothetical protein